jgi:hypothetical protein
MQERRAYPRLKERAAVALTLDAELAPEPRELGWNAAFCPATDLSIGGIQVELHERLPQDSSVKMEIALEKPDEVFVHSGRVAWVHDVVDGVAYATGIAFADANGSRLDVWRGALMARYGAAAVAS